MFFSQSVLCFSRAHIQIRKYSGTKQTINFKWPNKKDTYAYSISVNNITSAFPPQVWMRSLSLHVTVQFQNEALIPARPTRSELTFMTRSMLSARSAQNMIYRKVIFFFNTDALFIITCIKLYTYSFVYIWY